MPIPFARVACAALIIAFAQPALAQQQGQQPGQQQRPQGPQGQQGQPPDDPQRRGPPPPHAYTDCKGKTAGDKVQHATPHGTVTATCMDSPEGLVARPERPPAPPPNDRQPNRQ